MTITYGYPFSEADSEAAFREWGANCGPNAIAFASQRPISEIRGIIPGFEEKRYTSPTMMRAALAELNVAFTAQSLFGHGRAIPTEMFNERIALVRIQWTGPWTAPGANPKWAYRQSHWVATWAHHEDVAPIVDDFKSTRVGLFVFDCNGGITSFKSWKEKIVPAITGTITKADGGWFPTHIWRFQCQHPGFAPATSATAPFATA